MNDDILKRAAEMLGSIKKQDKNAKEQLERDRRDLVLGVGQQITDTLKPMLQELVAQGKMTRDDLQEAISKITVETNTPDVYVPEIKVPEPRVTVSVPPIKVPDIVMPDEMNVRGWVSLMGVDLNNPLPVQLRDAKGNPINLFENLTQIISGGGGGGKHDYFTIRGFGASAYADYLNADNRLRVSFETGTGGLTDTELRASSVPVAQASGANWSTNVTNVDLDIRDLANGTDSVSAYQVSGAVWSTNVVTTVDLTDTQLRASSVPVEQVSGSNWSTNIIGTVPVSGPLTDTQLRASSIPVEQVSGANWSTNIIGTVPVSGPLTDTQLRASSVPVEQVSGSNWSTSVTNTVTVSVSGSIASTVATGPSAVGVADDGTAPIQMSGIARTANPTAVSGGQVVKSTHDDLGRQLVRPVQVRDLISTAYVSLTTGTETTFLAAVAGVYLDLLYVMGTNSSDAAVTVDLRAVTAGNVQTSIRIPANGTAGVSLGLVGIPQDETGNNWTADLPDITGTTVTLSGLFSREV